jgi:hypothetical protein
MYDNNFSPRNSGYNVNKVDEELDAKPQLEMLNAKPVAACDVVATNADADSQYRFIVPKRAASEVDDSMSEWAPSKRSARRDKEVSLSSDEGETSSGEKRRVGCPFYKKDPQSHLDRMSCRGRGWAEMGKLKQVLPSTQCSQADANDTQGPSQTSPSSSSQSLQD